MDYNLGTARGKIVIESDGKGIENANQQLGNLNQRQRAGADAAQSLGRGLLVTGGAALAGFGIAVNAAADFESQLSAIEAVSQGTEEQMEAVRKKALQLGQDTKFSAGEAAGAIEELSRRGIALDDILAGAADAAVNLAAATGSDIATAATIASNAMNIFGLSAEDLDDVVNKIAGFDVVGSSIEDFNLALAQSGAVADLVGVPFADLTTAIGLMSRAGINGSDAGTSLKTMLNNLQPTTKKQIALATELGILTEDGSNQFYDQAGNLKSLADVSEVLYQATKDLTAQQRQQALETLFGSDAIRAAAVIAEGGGAAFTELQNQINAVDAGEQAAIRMDNLAGSIEQLKGSIETYLIGAGTPFLDSIRGIIDGITGLVNWFGNLPAPVQKIISQFVLFAGIAFVTAGAFSYFLGTFVKFAQTLSAFKGLFTLASGAGKASKAMGALNLAFLANPVFLLIVAIIALGVALVIAYKKSEKFRNFVNGLGEDIKKIWGAIVKFFKSLPAIFTRIWNDVKSAFSSAADAVVDAWESVVDWFQKLPGIIGDALSAALSAAGNFITQLPEMIGFAIGRVIRLWLDFHLMLFNTVVEWVPKVVGFIIGKLMELVAWLPGFLSGMIQRFIGWGQQLLAWAFQTFVSLVQTIVNQLISLPGKVAGFFTQIISALPGFASSMFSGALDIGKKLVNGLVQGVGDLVKLVKDMVLGAINGVSGLGQTAYNKMKSIGESMWNGFKKGLFGSPYTKVEYAVWTMTDNVKKSIGTLSRQVGQIQSLGASLPGMAITTSVATNPATTDALVGVGSSSSVQQPEQGGFTWQQNGPLIGNATIRSQQDIEELAIALERRVRAKARGRGVPVDA